MILTKQDFEKFGFEYVIEHPVPVSIIFGCPMVAKTFKYESIGKLKEEDWFKDTLVAQTPIVLCPMTIDGDDIRFRMFWVGDTK
jgi:hypothetical protein